MALGELYLGIAGSEAVIPAYGRTLTINDQEFSKEQRTASCRLVKDIKEGSPKKQFTLSYSMIDGDVLEDLIDLYELETELSLIVYITDSVYEQYYVIMLPVERERVLILDDGLWGGVNIVLNEI